MAMHLHFGCTVATVALFKPLQPTIQIDYAKKMRGERRCILNFLSHMHNKTRVQECAMSPPNNIKILFYITI
jgi:hypothetical protein